jgi:hypothetical protein
MIAWLNPMALFGLLGVAIPILIHLLRQPSATRVPFPSLRFVGPSRTIAARMRRLTDVPLLAVRMLLVALAALALAQPVLLTPARLDAWNARTARAIVLDVSPALARGGAAAEAREAAADERAAAFMSTILESADLPAAIRRARDWVETAPPARREIVVISDFRHGAWTPASIADLGGNIGVRLRQVGTAAGEHRFSEPPQLDGVAAEVWLRGAATVAAFSESSARSGTRGIEGADDAIGVVAAAGTPAGDHEEPIRFTFAGSGLPAGIAPLRAGWMLSTAVGMAEDSDLRSAALDAAAARAIGDGEPWYPVARARDGRVVVRAARAGERLHIDVAGAPDSLLAAAALRSALLARAARAARSEHEIVRATSEDLARLTRTPAPVGPEAVAHADRSDGRWLWALVVGLMVFETRMRRSRAAGAGEVAARAA